MRRFGIWGSLSIILLYANLFSVPTFGSNTASRSSAPQSPLQAVQSDYLNENWKGMARSMRSAFSTYPQNSVARTSLFQFFNKAEAAGGGPALTSPAAEARFLTLTLEAIYSNSRPRPFYRLVTSIQNQDSFQGIKLHLPESLANSFNRQQRMEIQSIKQAVFSSDLSPQPLPPDYYSGELLFTDRPPLQISFIYAPEDAHADYYRVLRPLPNQTIPAGKTLEVELGGTEFLPQEMQIIVTLVQPVANRALQENAQSLRPRSFKAAMRVPLQVEPGNYDLYVSLRNSRGFTGAVRMRTDYVWVIPISIGPSTKP